MDTIVILNGPNLDRLGKREPEIYGHATLADLEEQLRQQAAQLEVEVACFQSNSESALVDRIWQAVDDGACGLIVNLAALTHTSVALRDALSGAGLPAVEVHLSNIHAREAFREKSLTAPVCAGIVSGLGLQGYGYALDFLVRQIRVS
ncbi:MAG: type II 3-dehydroquinate dehydratase [Opitutales bacterium]